MKQISIFIVLVLMTSAACGLNKEDIKEVSNFAIEFNEQAKDVVIMKTDSGYVEMILNSPLLQREIQQNRIIDHFPKGLKIEFFNKNKELEASLEAQYAERIENEGKIFAKDSVIITNRRGDQLKTSQIYWSDKENTLENNQLIILTNAETKDTLIGFGILADQNFSNFEVKKRFASISKMEEITKIIQ